MNTVSNNNNNTDFVETYAWVDALLEHRALQEQRDYEARNVEDLEDEDEDEEDEEDEEDDNEMYNCPRCNDAIDSIQGLVMHKDICYTIPVALSQILSKTRPTQMLRTTVPENYDDEDEDETLFERKRQKCFHEYNAIPMDISDDDTVSYVSNAEELEEGEIEEVEEHYELEPRQLFADYEDEDDQLSVMSDIEIEPIDIWNIEYMLPLGGTIINNILPAEYLNMYHQNGEMVYNGNADGTRTFENENIADEYLYEEEEDKMDRYHYNMYELEVVWQFGQLVVTEQDAAEVARLRREIADYERTRIIT